MLCLCFVLTTSNMSSAAAASSSSAASSPSLADPVTLQRVDLLCPVCSPESRLSHFLLRQHQLSDQDDDNGPSVVTIHQRVHCAACHVIRDRYQSWMTDDAHHRRNEDGEDEFDCESMVSEFSLEGLVAPNCKRLRYSPFKGPDEQKKNTPHEPESDHAFFVSSELRDCVLRASPLLGRLLLEVEHAARSSSWLLWTMGLRMLLEGVTNHFYIEARYGNGGQLPLHDRIPLLAHAMQGRIPDCNFTDLQSVCNDMYQVKSYGNHAAHYCHLVDHRESTMLFAQMQRLLECLFLLPEHQEKIFRRFSHLASQSGTGAVGDASNQ